MEERQQLLNQDEKILEIPRPVFFFRVRRALMTVGLYIIIQAIFPFSQFVSSLSFLVTASDKITCRHGQETNHMAQSPHHLSPNPMRDLTPCLPFNPALSTAFSHPV